MSPINKRRRLALARSFGRSFAKCFSKLFLYGLCERGHDCRIHQEAGPARLRGEAFPLGSPIKKLKMD